jgi:hypothetical protein
MRARMAAVRADNTSPDMRLADSALPFNPASILALTQLVEGGLYLQHGSGLPPTPDSGDKNASDANLQDGSWASSSPSQGGTLLFARLRHFDPERRRAGLPPDVAVLVDSWSDDGLTATVINISPSQSRSLIIQGGAYGEHQIVSVTDGKTTQMVNARAFPVRLAPGAGTKLTIKMKRFANDPTLAFPWEDTVADTVAVPA